jgi:hypothetical protein
MKMRTGLNLLTGLLLISTITTACQQASEVKKEITFTNVPCAETNYLPNKTSEDFDFFSINIISVDKIRYNWYLQQLADQGIDPNTIFDPEKSWTSQQVNDEISKQTKGTPLEKLSGEVVEIDCVRKHSAYNFDTKLCLIGATNQIGFCKEDGTQLGTKVYNGDQYSEIHNFPTGLPTNSTIKIVNTEGLTLYPRQSKESR